MLNSMGLLVLLFGNSEDGKRREMESIKDNLVHLYCYSRKRLTRMSDEEKKDLWYEEEECEWND